MPRCAVEKTARLVELGCPGGTWWTGEWGKEGILVVGESINLKEHMEHHGTMFCLMFPYVCFSPFRRCTRNH